MARNHFIPLMAIIAVVGMAFLLVLTIGGQAPADWNPNEDCAQHGGTVQVHGQNYAAGAVCKDGTYLRNPYE